MKRTFALLAVVLSVSLCGSATWAATYNPQTAFAGVNPNGVWSYGMLTSTNPNPATNLVLFSTYSTNNNASGVNVWSNLPTNSPFPGIFDNTNSSTTTVYSTIQIPGNTLVLHPANDDTEVQQTDLRFTAPIALDVSNIAATFAAADTSGTTSDAHVYVNGVLVFSHAINNAGNGTETFNSGPLVLTAGETVDFTVDDGGNTYGNDGTSLVASITAVAAPEPSSLVALAGLGLAGLVGLVRYRRRRAA
jgi:MYXO-CTERM domain-containing protein